MKRISGGQLSREAKPRFYQVTPKVLGRRRRHKLYRSGQSSRHSSRESARRQPEDLPDASDVTAQTLITLTVTAVWGPWPDWRLSESLVRLAGNGWCSIEACPPKRAPAALLAYVELKGVLVGCGLRRADFVEVVHPYG